MGGGGREELFLPVVLVVKPSGDERIFDIGIVGGGPAGLSAAIWSARYLHSVALVDSGDPRNWETRGIHGFLGFEGVRPAELRGHGRDLCRQMGVKLVDAIVLRADRVSDEQFMLCIEGGGRNGEEGRRHHLAQHIHQYVFRFQMPRPQPKLVLGLKQGPEERHAGDVIEMGVAEEYIRIDRRPAFQRPAKLAQPGAAIENKQAIAAAHLDACGVAAITDV